MKNVSTSLVVFLLIIAFVLGLSACGKAEHEVNFFVDSALYDTVITRGEEIIIMPKDPTKEGYTFDGWYLDKDVWRKPLTAKSLLYTSLSSDMSAYAKWTPNYIKEGLQLTLKGDTYSVTGYTGTSSAVTIPTQHDGVNVTAIDSGAFKDNTTITAVTIPDSVRSIGESSFRGCTSLTSITIPDSVISIGDSAFRSCSSLASVAVGNGVTSIGDSAFRDCTSLTSITIPDSVTSIGDSSFSSCSSLASVTVGNGVADIGENAFRSCSALSAVYISDIVAWCSIIFKTSTANPLSYANNLYLNGTLVTELAIPNSVTGIGDCAFYGCRSLTSITLPDSVTSIGGAAFYDCSSLASVIIPDGITSISSYAFYGCSSLASVIIPDSIKSIGSYAFYGCLSLASITIPKGVTSIGDNAFENCYKLVEVIDNSSLNISLGSGYGKVADYAIEVHTGDSKIVNYNDYLFYTYSGKNYLIAYVGDDTKLALPDNYNNESYEIYNRAFYNCEGITSVTIPSSVTSIGSYAFFGCSGLTSVIIPDSVTKIGYDAFYNCRSLTSVIIGNGVTTIDENAFYCCSKLMSINIGNSVTSIASNAFSGCYKLVEVINKSNLIIAPGSEQYGKVAYYAIEVHTGDSKIVNYNDYLFYTCDAGNYLVGYVGDATELVLPDSYNNESYEIYRYAFKFSPTLTSITIPDSVTGIGEYAFANCGNITSVTVGNGVTSIGKCAFSNCWQLTSLTFSDAGAWYRTTDSDYANGTIVVLINPSNNATYFRDTYNGYYWYKE